MFLFSLFSRAFTWILQQVCCFTFLLQSSFKVVFLFVCLPFWAGTEMCRSNGVDTFSPAGHARPHSFSPPFPSSLFPRLTALSLRNMRLCPVFDAEAHGEDGNDCPVQFHLSNGELFLFFPLILGCRVLLICTTHHVVCFILWSVEALFVSCREENITKMTDLGFWTIRRT